MIFIENTSHDIITVWNCSKISLLPFLLEKGVDNGEKFFILYGFQHRSLK